MQILNQRAIGHFGVYMQQIFKVIYKGGFYFGGSKNTSEGWPFFILFDPSIMAYCSWVSNLHIVDLLTCTYTNFHLVRDDFGVMYVGAILVIDYLNMFQLLD